MATVVSGIAAATVGGSLTVTVKTSSTNSPPLSVARIVIVAVPLVLAVKLRSRVGSAP